MPETRKGSLKTNEDESPQIIQTIKDEVKSILEKFKEEFRQEMISSISTSVNRSVKSLIEVLTRRVSSLESRIEDIEHQVGTMQRDSVQNETRVRPEQAEEQLKLVINEVEQRRLRETNLIISGIREETNGSVEDRQIHDDRKVQQILSTLKVNSNCVQGISRIGRQRYDRPRLIRLKCKDLQSKKQILYLAKNLRTTEHKSVFINPDYTIQEQKTQKRLREELRERKEMNEDVIIFRGKVIRRSEKQDF